MVVPAYTSSNERLRQEDCTLKARLLLHHVSALVNFYVNLTQLESFQKGKSQLRKCPTILAYGLACGAFGGGYICINFLTF